MSRSLRTRLPLITLLPLLLAAPVAMASEITAPWPDAAGATRLQVTLGSVLVPNGELVGWALNVDGRAVVPPTPAATTRVWEGAVAPGLHTVALRLLYRRDLKALIDHPKDRILGFTFVGAGSRWLDQLHSVDVADGALVHLHATITDDPAAIDDHLVVTTSTLVGSEPETAPRLEVPVASTSRTPTDPAALARERARFVAALVSPSLIQETGSGGDAHVRFAVDPRGYLLDAQLERSTGVPRLDAHVEEVLRLAAPFPVFDGYTTVTLPFALRDELPPDPLAKTDAPVIRTPQVVLQLDQVKIRFRGEPVARR